MRHWLGFLAFVVMGCGSGEKGSIEDTVSDLSSSSFSKNMKVVGSFTAGQSYGAAVTYSPTPRYRAVKVVANAGDLLMVHITPQFLGKGQSNPSDPVTWLLDGSFHKIDFDDDALQTDTSSLLVDTLPSSYKHVYWVVFRDYYEDPAQFQVDVEAVRMTGDLLADAGEQYNLYFAALSDYADQKDQFKIDPSELPSAAQAQAAAYQKATSATVNAYLMYVRDQPVYIAAYPVEEYYWVDLYDGDGNFLGHGNNGDGDPSIQSWSTQPPSDPSHP